jgi:pyruvate/2-oxoglutarate dehydrogenase complex dihydrolipoamide acyltransferase (E2) component
MRCACVYVCVRDRDREYCAYCCPGNDAVFVNKLFPRSDIGAILRRPSRSSLSCVANLNCWMMSNAGVAHNCICCSCSKKLGDKVSANDVLLVVESDKADMDVESFDEGFLASVIVPSDGVARVGQAVGLLADSADQMDSVSRFGDAVKAAGGDVDAVLSSSSAASSGGQAHHPAQSVGCTTQTLSPSVGGGSASGQRPLLSGYAHSVAAANKIDPNTLTSSRSDGVISSKDVLGAMHRQPEQQSAGAPAKAGSTHVSAPGVLNVSPMARKAAAEHKVDLKQVKGTGNFNRITEDDVLIFAGKKQPKQTQPQAAPAAASTSGATASASAAGKQTSSAGAPAAASNNLLADMGDRYVTMDGMQKAVVKNMEKSLTVPVFRVSR